jgi:hypothetical protein
VVFFAAIVISCSTFCVCWYRTQLILTTTKDCLS